MARSILVDPVTRIEGHLAVRLEVDGGRVVNAFSVGEMFRGFERLLQGRHPMDAQHIVQRICGVCPISHGTASTFAQEMAYKVAPPPNARLMRNLMLGANYIQSHLIHFYQLSALDFIDIAAITTYTGNDARLASLRDWVAGQVASGMAGPAAPFLPRYTANYLQDADLNFLAIQHYLEALDMRALAHECVALFGAKVPHAMTIVPGGVTQPVRAESIAAYASKMDQLLAFIVNKYIPDVIAVAKAFGDYFTLGRNPGGFLAYGAFPENDAGADLFLPGGTLIEGTCDPLDVAAITEDVTSSRFSSPSGLHPAQGETEPAPQKAGAYTWLKAPRYRGRPMEVGSLARLLIAYNKGMPAAKAAVDGLLAAIGKDASALNSVMGRHAARAIESQIIAERCLAWAAQLKPGEPACTAFEMPAEGQGFGLTEATRGALGHWLTVEGGKIARYQCVVPTTWNCSPRDGAGVAGPVEQSLAGTPVADEANPIEAVRVVRSFDPCIACAVH